MPDEYEAQVPHDEDQSQPCITSFEMEANLSSGNEIQIYGSRVDADENEDVTTKLLVDEICQKLQHLTNPPNGVEVELDQDEIYNAPSEKLPQMTTYDSECPKPPLPPKKRITIPELTIDHFFEFFESPLAS